MSDAKNHNKLPPVPVLVSAMEQTGVAYIYCGPDRLIQWVNKAFTDVTGYTLQEVEGRLMRDLELVRPMKQTVINGSLLKLIKFGEVRVDAEIEHKDGHLVSIDFWFREIRDEHGAMQGLLVSAIDTSKINRARKRLNAFLENATVGIVVQDHEGKIIECNPEAERLLGQTRDQIMGRTSRDPRWRSVDRDGNPTDGSQHPASRTLRTGEPVREEMMGIHLPTGELRWLLVNSRAFPNEMDGRRNVIVSFTDMTAKKQKTELLERANKEIDQARGRAEAAMRAKASFLATMSHELRTPINGIIGFVEVLQFSHLEADQKEYVQIAERSARDLLHLINDILDFSKLESGRMQIEPRLIDPSDELSRVMRLLSPEAHAKGLQLTSTVIGPQIGFFGDSVRLGQIFLNLIGNAIKFTPHGQVDVTMKLSETDGRANLRVEVKDTGIGIPKAAQATMFERFTQADETIARRFNGTGLGLAICKELVELMGGAIGFESVEGEGTKFWFELSSAAEEHNDAAQQAVIQKRAS